MISMKIILCISIQGIKVKLWCIGTCLPPKPSHYEQQQLLLWLVILAMHQYQHEMGQLVIRIFVFVSFSVPTFYYTFLIFLYDVSES